MSMVEWGPSGVPRGGVVEHEGGGRGLGYSGPSIPQGACEDFGSCEVTPPVISLFLRQEADPPPERDFVPQGPLHLQPCSYDPVHQ